jgi:hypothetical protein
MTILLAAPQYSELFPEQANTLHCDIYLLSSTGILDTIATPFKSRFGQDRKVHY